MFTYPVIDLSQYIETRLMDNRPHIKGRRISIWVIAHTLADNPTLSITDLADNFGVDEPTILASLLYYGQHQAEIDEKETAINAQYE